MTHILSDTSLSEMMTYAKQAQSAYLWMEPAAIDHILHHICDGFSPLCSDLARASVEETRMGIYEDKLICLNRTLQDIRKQYLPFCSPPYTRLSRMDSHIQLQPAGIIAGVTDQLQPAAAVLFSCVTAIRTRNPIILAFHPSASLSAYTAAAAIRDLAVAAGAPDNCIQWLDEDTPELLETLLEPPEIAALTLSGFPSVIGPYAALSHKPYAAVYPTGVFCYIHQSADIQRAVRQLILSRTFDNGLLYSSEQIICVDQSIYVPFKEMLKNEGCYLTSEEETTRLTAVLIDLSSDMVNPAVMGQTPHTIAALADITLPEDTRLIAMEMPVERSDHPLLIPFLCPAILFMPVEHPEQAADRIRQLSSPESDFPVEDLLQRETKLPPIRSLIIHTSDKHTVSALAHALPEFTIIENAPATGQSLTDQYVNRYGSRLDARSMEHQLSLCRSRQQLPDRPHTFRLPSVLHFQKGALARLRLSDALTRIAFLYKAADEPQSDWPQIARAIQKQYPSLKYHGIAVPADTPDGRASDYLLPQLTEIVPDCLIAIGDARIIHTAKMLLTDFRQSMPDHSVQLILIPSIEGCRAAALPAYGLYDPLRGACADKPASVQAAAIIADCSLHLTSSEDQTCPSVHDDALPAACLSAMADAFDAFLSNLGDDLTDALALQAICLFFTWLPKLADSRQHNDLPACLEHLQNACLLSGMAAAHTGTGLSRIMAGRLYCDFRIAPTILQTILLPHVLLYNGDPQPSKLSWELPTTRNVISDKLAQLSLLTLRDVSDDASLSAHMTAAPADNSAQLAEYIRSLMKAFDLPMTIKACGIREKDYMTRADIMARQTFEQLSTDYADANPRYPLIKELTQLFKKIYS